MFLRGELRILALWWHGGLKRWGYQTQYTNQRVPKKKRQKERWFPKVLDSKSKQTSPKKKRITPSCPLSNTMMWRVLLRGRRWAIRDQGCWTYSLLFYLIFAYHHPHLPSMNNLHFCELINNELEILTYTWSIKFYIP